MTALATIALGATNEASSLSSLQVVLDRTLASAVPSPFGVTSEIVYPPLAYVDAQESTSWTYQLAWL